MRLGSVGAGLAAWAGAVLSSLCCLLPLSVIALGLGTGAFMAVTMQYRRILLPAGAIGLATGFALYVRERRRCDALGCRMAASRITLALLIVASLVVATAVVLDLFPEMTSEILARLIGGSAQGAPSQDMREMDMRGMR